MGVSVRGAGWPEVSCPAIVPVADSPESYTPEEAAKLLGITRRRVLQLIQEGGLEGEQEEGGGWWRVYQRSVHARRDHKPPRSKRPADDSQGAVAAHHEWIERAKRRPRARVRALRGPPRARGRGAFHARGILAKRTR